MSLNMGYACNQDKSTKPTSFHKLMTSFDFLSSLVITRSIFDLTLPVTQLLQGPAKDTADATHLIESLKSLICCKRDTDDTFHNKCYSDILELAYKAGIEDCKPRTLKLQRNHSLVYKNVNWKEIFNLFAQLFKDDFPCPKALEAELELWQTYCLESKDCLPDNTSSTLKRIQFDGFNNIKVCLRILGTSPVTACTCEWSCYETTAMRQPKTYVRSTMVSERLNGIALMHGHQEIVLELYQ